MRFKFIYFLLMFISGLSTSAQSPKIDSLRNLLVKDANDKDRLRIYNQMAAEFKARVPDSCLLYGKKALAIATEINLSEETAESYLWMGTGAFGLGRSDEASAYLSEAKSRYLEEIKKDRSASKIKKLALAYNNLGNVYSSNGDYINALKNHQEALNYRKEIKDDAGLASSYNNLAVTYATQGNYSEALKNHFSSLKMKEKLGNKEGMAVSLNNIANIYKDQGDQKKALDNLFKALNISKELQLYNITTTCYNNIGAIYTDQKKYKEALLCLKEAYGISRKTGDVESMANALGNIGAVNLERNNLEEALKNEFEALKLKQEIGDNLGIAAFKSTIAKIYLKKNDLSKAILFGEEALKLSKEIGALFYYSESAYTLATCYDLKKDFTKAYAMQKAYYASRDSLQSINNQEELFRQELKYSYDKQAVTDSLNFANKKKLMQLENEVKLKGERNIRIGLFIGLFITLVFAIFIFNRFRITRKQKIIIEQQSKRLEFTHNQLALKSKELNDSILYSKEIQNAFLKSPTNSKRWLNDTVLVYKPKDIVSGDFYWYKAKGDLLFVAVGDSTGHGVPGAIISVLAIQFFEKTINKIESYESLHLLNEFMKEEFNKYNNSESNVNIGLDYSIVCINKSDGKVYISGSGENVIVKLSNAELVTHKLESINIGGVTPAIYNPETFIYNINEVQSLFIYTDGVIDQKGGPDKKKFGSKKLKELIADLRTNDSAEAKLYLESKLDAWIGDNKQVDDITLLGIQLTQ